MKKSKVQFTNMAAFFKAMGEVAGTHAVYNILGQSHEEMSSSSDWSIVIKTTGYIVGGYARIEVTTTLLDK